MFQYFRPLNVCSQSMNTSYEPLRIVNSYGYFGSITKERNEIVVMGSRSLNSLENL